MNQSSIPAVRLSCEECKRRKTKCDKLVPCTACKNAGIKCNTVQRARRPRGRTAQHKGGEIDTRVARLEDLVKQLKAQVQSGGKASEIGHENSSNHSSPSPLPKESNPLQNYVAPDFWEALSQEANGIREILEEVDHEDSPSENASNSPMSASEPSSISGALLFHQSAAETSPDLTLVVPKEMKGILFPIYRTRVDCIIKILHWPSTMAAIEKKDSSPRDGLESDRVQALESAICYAALCTMTDEESETSLSRKKNALGEQLRHAAETSISKARFLEQPNLTVLQAFLIYLLGLRCSTTDASAWTLLSLAVRIGSALGLGSEDPSKFSIFDLEIRRRVWSSIGVLDAQLALDRGAPALLSSQELQKTPLNINDSELYPGCPPPLVSTGFTDMSFASMTHRASLCQKTMEEIPPDTDDSWSRWKEKLAAIEKFEAYSMLHFSGIDAWSPPLQKFAQAVAGGSLANIKLMTRRPPYRNRQTKIPPWDDYNVMKSTTWILERSLFKQENSEFNPWAWFTWVKWYALAVLLAELCGPIKGLEADHANVVAQRIFVEYAQVVADSQSGMLWRPIVKLMRRVQKLRGSTVESLSSLLSSSSPGSQQPVMSESAIDHSTFAGLNINQSYLTQDTELRPDPSFGDPNMITSGHTTYGLTNFESGQAFGTDLVPDDGLSWAHWDSFLEDMDNSTNFDWAMDWQNNSLQS
ncbi:hypothetical protein BKA64DRAFT_404214 [Cadophora sp. MPI-SDFR-AT-0126]|nr:hypothetical protein BKA64DRAFT_404214 [Leotiomycetes sp. MPI-SDFR-AT-0126]